MRADNIPSRARRGRSEGNRRFAHGHAWVVESRVLSGKQEEPLSTQTGDHIKASTLDREENCSYHILQDQHGAALLGTEVQVMQSGAGEPLRMTYHLKGVWVPSGRPEKPTFLAEGPSGLVLRYVAALRAKTQEDRERFQAAREGRIAPPEGFSATPDYAIQDDRSGDFWMLS